VFAVFLALPLVVGALAVALRPEVITAGYGDRPFTVAERLLTQSRVLFSYLGQLVLPRGADTGLFHDDYPLSRGLLDPPTTALAILAWGALLAWLWRARGTLGLAAFGLAFFLAGHALESSVIPLETYFEHRNYLPAVGVFVAVAAVGLRAMQALPRIRPAVVALLVGVPLAYAAATHARALVWSDLTTLLRVTYLAHPDSPRLNAFLAEHYAAQGALPEALGHLERLVALDPDAAAGAAVSRLYVHCRSGRVPDGDAYAELERQLGFRRQAYLINTVKVLTEDLWTGRCPEVDAGRLADILQRWVDADTGTSAEMRWVVRVHLARVQLALRRDAAALANLDAASRLLPRRLEPGILRLRYQVDKGDAAGARKTLEGLRRIDDGGSTHLTRALQLFEGLLAEMEARRPDV
jgi:tetratricopeptide (TPR) repeat protein